DRFDRRRILLVVQTVTASIHLTTAILVLSGAIQPWHVYVLGFTMGSSMAFNQPARQALIPSLVDKEHLTNAIALNTVAMNTMRIVGTAVGGILIGTVGVGNVYLLNVVLYAWLIIMTFKIQVPSSRQPERPRESMLGSLTEGLRYARQNRAALGAIALATALFLFGMPYVSIFIPLFAIDVLKIGSFGMGLLMMSTGVGALLGALTIATIGNIRHRGRILIMGVILYGATLIAFSSVSFLHVLPLSFVLIGVVGLLGTSYMSINTTVLLGSAPPEMHGRIMSLTSLDRGLVPLGAMMAALLAASVGPQWGLIIFGSLCIFTASAIALLIPSIRQID
ncbi:MAG: MFS transporter, partial [Dehalococcoidia bacterium]